MLTRYRKPEIIAQLHLFLVFKLEYLPFLLWMGLLFPLSERGSASTTSITFPLILFPEDL